MKHITKSHIIYPTGGFIEISQGYIVVDIVFIFIACHQRAKVGDKATILNPNIGYYAVVFTTTVLS